MGSSRGNSLSTCMGKTAYRSPDPALAGPHAVDSPLLSCLHTYQKKSYGSFIFIVIPLVVLLHSLSASEMLFS